MLSNFKWFRGSTPLGGWQMSRLGWRWVWVCGGVSHACTHAHICTFMHARMHMHVKHVNMINMDASMSVAICNFYTCINVCVCMCVHAHACACGGTPPHAPRFHPTHLPPPQSCREPKTPKFNKSWTNRDNSILFEDSLPLNIPELI